MKPRNFPGRKVLRRQTAQFGYGFVDLTETKAEFEAARQIRTKKSRGGRKGGAA